MLESIKNYFKNSGWMFLPPSWIPYDKQKHGIAAAFITVISFFMLQDMFNVSVLCASLLSFVINALIAFLIEFYQKFTKTGVFDIDDALIMLQVNFVILIFLILRMYQLGTYSP